LDSESINGLNLYVYCGNDPVNRYDPSGHFAITLSALLTSIGIGALFGVGISTAEALAEGERGWDLFWDIVGGAFMGAATGAIIALGGAAGLAATGAPLKIAATSTVLKMSVGTALGISAGTMAFASATKYSLDCAASDRQWSMGGYVIEALQGAVQGILTFKIAQLGGQIGLFNKLAELSAPDVFFTQYGGMNLLRSIVWGSKVLIGEMLSKTILVSGTSAIIRLIIDLLIPKFY